MWETAVMPVPTTTRPPAALLWAMTITDLSAPRELNAEHGNRSEAARRRNPGYRHVTAPAPCLRLQFAALAEQAEMNGAGKAAAAQHEQSGEGLLQAHGAERHVPCRTCDRLADKGGLVRVDMVRIDLAAARCGLSNAEQAQCPRQRQQRQCYAHHKQKQRRLAGGTLLSTGQGEKTGERRDQANLTTSCSTICVSRAVTSASIVARSAS